MFPPYTHPFWLVDSSPAIREPARAVEALVRVLTSAQPRVPFFLTWKHGCDFFQSLLRFALQRVLQKNLGLHDQVFERLYFAPFFAHGLRRA